MTAATDFGNDWSDPVRGDFGMLATFTGIDTIPEMIGVTGFRIHVDDGCVEFVPIRKA
jgi:hypothetical protein